MATQILSDEEIKLPLARKNTDYLDKEKDVHKLETMEDLWPLIFESFDANGDGKLSRSELQNAMKDAGNVGKVLAAADLNADNEVSLDEWFEMYDIMIEKYGEPDAASIKHVKQILDKFR